MDKEEETEALIFCWFLLLDVSPIYGGFDLMQNYGDRVSAKDAVYPVSFRLAPFLCL